MFVGHGRPPAVRVAAAAAGCRRVPPVGNAAAVFHKLRRVYSGCSRGDSSLGCAGSSSRGPSTLLSGARQMGLLRSATAVLLMAVGWCKCSK